MKNKQARKRSGFLNFRLSIFFICLIIFQNSFSIDSVELFIQKISFEQFLDQSVSKGKKQIDSSELNDLKKQGKLFKQLNLDKLSLSINLTSSPIQFQIDLSELQLPEPYNKISTLNIICDDISFNASEMTCKEGHLSFKDLIEQSLTSAEFSLMFDHSRDKLNLEIKNVNIGKGQLSFSILVNDNVWSSNFNINQLDYEYIKPYINFYLSKNNKDIVDKLSNTGGIMNLSGYASGVISSNSQSSSSSALDTLKMKGHVKNVRYEYVDDLAENLSFDFKIDVKAKPDSIKKINPHQSNNYKVSLSIDTHSGELIQNDIYIVLTGKEKMRLSLDYHNSNAINFSHFKLYSSDIFSMKSKGKIFLNRAIPLQSLDAHLDIINLSEFNQLYLNNILSGTDYEELQIEGEISTNIKKELSSVKFFTEFSDFSMELTDQFSLIDLNGKLFWNNLKPEKKKKNVSSSHLTWGELILNGLPLGASKFNFITHNDYLKLEQEMDIPIFDGALHLNTLEISQMFPQTGSVQIHSTNDISDKPHKKYSDGLTLTVDGMIKPVSMSLLSSHFEWPLLDGSLSAVIPSTTYNEKQLIVGGALMMQLFDGNIIIKDLQIDEPLQDYAQLSANIDLNNLDLQSLTRTYNFGEIEGRVEGKINKLELSAWEPVAFDAYIRTPSNDKSSHRISQRAIDNLSSLGGASGLLSRSFLSFFETFRYDKIGLSCKLKNNICRMSGVEAKGNSYYIVKGGGIPRIDVMVYQTQVNWKVLTTRLKAIQSANEAVIE
ncbi:MAG: hypothetical protein OQL19_02720 [Gammaproteobacteria bacterium]|nr:hypothetical protein [Gammaproteobacteria bacterium]